MQLSKQKGRGGKNLWNIDKNGADDWEQIFEDGNAPGIGSVYFSSLQKGLKEDLIWDEEENIRVRDTLDLSRGVWMRIDVIQASPDFTPDTLFENALPELVSDDGTALTEKEIEAIEEIKGEEFKGKGKSRNSMEEAKKAAESSARKKALAAAKLDQDTARLVMQEIPEKAKSRVSDPKMFYYESKWKANSKSTL